MDPPPPVFERLVLSCRACGGVDMLDLQEGVMTPERLRYMSPRCSNAARATSTSRWRASDYVFSSALRQMRDQETPGVIMPCYSAVPPCRGAGRHFRFNPTRRGSGAGLPKRPYLLSVRGWSLACGVMSVSPRHSGVTAQAKTIMARRGAPRNRRSVLLGPPFLGSADDLFKTAR